MTNLTAPSIQNSQLLKRNTNLYSRNTLIAHLALLLASSSIAAQTAAEQHSSHLQKNTLVVNQSVVRQPTEAGQGAFATIAEIVQLLQNDPTTDWSKVDIAALQTHLVNMHQVTLQSTVTRQYSDNKVVFTIEGSGDTIASIQTMVLAHTAEIAATTPWHSNVQNISSGVLLQMTADNPAELQKLKALGFYGVMATGSHHQAHHLLLAKGTSAHAEHN